MPLSINTHRGLYRFKRLSFGVKVAAAIFQRVMDTVLSVLDFAVANLDDILMKSKSIIENKEHVHKVFTKIQNYGLKIKETKCDFSWKKIKYLGHIIDKDGRRPDPKLALNNIASL